MRPYIFIVSALSFFFVLAGVPARAQTTAVGPYLATPAWDQTIACTTQASCPRFVVLSNFNSEAVLDRETGLVWERSPDTNGRIWFVAYLHCADRVVSKRSGWRLPSVQELLSLIDPAVSSGLRLPPGHPFFNIQESFYWSATNFPESPFAALAPFLGTIFTTLGGVTKDSPQLAWCVRGGQGPDPH